MKKRIVTAMLAFALATGGVAAGSVGANALTPPTPSTQEHSAWLPQPPKRTCQWIWQGYQKYYVCW